MEPMASQVAVQDLVGSSAYQCAYSRLHWVEFVTYLRKEHEVVEVLRDLLEVGTDGACGVAVLCCHA
jgi:hypothetical protein